MRIRALYRGSADSEGRFLLWEAAFSAAFSSSAAAKKGRQTGFFKFQEIVVISPSDAIL